VKEVVTALLEYIQRIRKQLITRIGSVAEVKVTVVLEYVVIYFLDFSPPQGNMLQ